MFGNSKREAPPPPRRKGAGLMNQMGMGEFEAELYGDLDNDEDLEAELAALQGQPHARKAKPRGPVNASDFDRMVAESMKDLDDEDISDTEDPDLLDELQELQEDDSSDSKPEAPGGSSGGGGGGGGVSSLLEERLTNYKEAADAATSAGDTSKAKRLGRGIKTLQDMLKQARQGKAVDEDDIPPQVFVTATKRSNAPPTQPQVTPPPMFEPTISPEPRPAPAPRKVAPPPPEPAPSQPNAGTSISSEDAEKKTFLQERRDQYKKAALTAKHGGDVTTATKYIRISKQFDKVITALDSGQPIDLSQMPPPPPGMSASSAVPSFVVSSSGPSPSKIQKEAVQRAGDEDGHPPSVATPPPPSEEEEANLFKAPEAPTTVMQALQQRLDKYKNAEQQAKDEGNSSKSRRMGRISKQYQEAIKDFKAGKQVDFEELPTPPGYAPIPVGQPQPKPAPSPAHSASGAGLQAPQSQGQGQRSPKPAPRSPQPPQGHSQSAAPPQQQHNAVGQHKASQKARHFKRGQSMRGDQQTQFLRERMQEYKVAAITAKKNGDLAMAKQYLRLAKGFEPMIDASESGLPVDLTQLPPPLNEDNDPSFVMVSKEECELSGDREEVFATLEQDLIAQIRTCTSNSTHFSKLGDVISANKFQKMESGLRKDLDALKNALRHKDPVPKFHYENRTFSMVQCNTDLGDNDLELNVVRGVQYNPPTGYSEKDLDTYVKYEFPFPNDEPQVGQGDTVKSSFNPEYQHTVKMTMNRKSRALVRVIERKTIKLEVFYKRGFLKSDKPLGTVNVKLTPLETQCTLHDSFDLTDGRKTAGGKLEVKIRIRDPFKNKQVEEVKEKWLVIDQFIKTMAKSSVSAQGEKKVVAGTICMEVLKFEKQQLDKQILSLRESLTESQLGALTNKSKQLQERIEQQQGQLKTGGRDAWKAYISGVDTEIQAYTIEAKQYAQHGEMQKAQLMLTKKKLAEKEVSAIRSKIPNI